MLWFALDYVLEDPKANNLPSFFTCYDAFEQLDYSTIMGIFPFLFSSQNTNGLGLAWVGCWDIAGMYYASQRIVMSKDATYQLCKNIFRE